MLLQRCERPCPRSHNTSLVRINGRVHCINLASEAGRWVGTQASCHMLAGVGHGSCADRHQTLPIAQPLSRLGHRDITVDARSAWLWPPTRCVRGCRILIRCSRHSTYLQGTAQPASRLRSSCALCRRCLALAKCAPSPTTEHAHSPCDRIHSSSIDALQSVASCSASRNARWHPCLLLQSATSTCRALRAQ